MANVLEQLKDEVKVSEACLTGIFWNKPSLYDLYDTDKLNRKTFLNDIWGFYFGLGRHMYEHGITVFDDVVTNKFVKDIGVQKTFEKYNEYETIQELMNEMKEKEGNLDGHYEEVKKYEVIVNLIDLFGNKVVKKNSGYDYKKMDKDQIYLYWQDKINNIGVTRDVKFDEQFLLENLEDIIDDWDENPITGLPFYNSRQMNRIVPGIIPGNVYIFGSNSGRGKSSITVNKLFLSAIEKKEKILVIANEMNLQMYRSLLIVTSLGVGTKQGFDRSRIQKGRYTPEEKEKLKNAVKWVKNLCNGDDKLITFVFMNNYIMNDVEKIIKYYAMRGIRYVIIDTSKVSQNYKSDQRWAGFGDDYRKLYELAREDGGGFNLGIYTTVQLSPGALKQRFLNEHALAEFKGITREASVVMLMRNVWADELEGGKNELLVHRYVKDPTGEQKYVKEEFKLDRDNQYYLLFTAKNRLGMDVNSGQQILVLCPNFNNNTWEEIGWTWVFDDKNF